MDSAQVKKATVLFTVLYAARPKDPSLPRCSITLQGCLHVQHMQHSLLTVSPQNSVGTRGLESTRTGRYGNAVGSPCTGRTPQPRLVRTRRNLPTPRELQFSILILLLSSCPPIFSRPLHSSCHQFEACRAIPASSSAEQRPLPSVRRLFMLGLRKRDRPEISNRTSGILTRASSPDRIGSDPSQRP